MRWTLTSPEEMRLNLGSELSKYIERHISPTWEIHSEIRAIWEKEEANLSPEARHFIAYAAELLKEEFGIKPKGSTVWTDLIETTEEDRFYDNPRE